MVLNVLGIGREQLNLVDAPADQNSAYPIVIPSTSQALPSLHTLFSHACPSRAPGDQYKLHSVLHEFLQTPLLAEEKTKQKKDRTQSALDLSPLLLYTHSLTFPYVAEQKSTAFANDPSAFLLAPSDMLSNNYRLPSYVEPPKAMDDPQDTNEGWTRTPPAGLPEGWVETPQVPLLDLSGNVAKQKIWAVDCEMVRH